MIQIPLYTSLIAKLDGLKDIENLSQCCLLVRFQSGTSLELDLRGQPLRLSEVERLVQNLLLTCFNSPWKSFGPLLVEDLAPLSATIYAVRLHKSSSSAVCEGLLSSVSVTSLTIDYDGASQDSGG